MKRILIVEDERDIQELLEAYLGDAGYETATAGDGIEAVSLFQQEAFDLVLLDVMLPKLDGFGVCELIRRQSRVPIVLLTALDGEAEQLRGFDLEIDDYITKPFSMPILLRKLAAVLLQAAGIDPAQPAGGLRNKQLSRLLEQLKSYQALVMSVNPFANAQVCCGGVDTRQVDPATMESRCRPGLYLAGEILDVDGICGGYNLQFAWSSGAVAGRNAARGHV